MTLTYFDAFTCFGPRRAAHGKHPWSFDHLIDELDHCSISAALVATTAQLVYDASFENQRLVDKLATHDWLHPVWNVYPHWAGDMPEPDDLIAQMRSRGIRAAHLNPLTNGWSLLSDTSHPLLGALEREQIATLIQYDTELNNFDTLEALLQRYPRLPLIVHHSRWGSGRNIISLLRNYPNLHVTMSQLQMNYGLEWLVEHGCENQLLFASHAPTMSAGAHRAYIDYADLDQPIKQKIAGGNLLRLLGDLKPPAPRENKNEDAIMAQARQGKPLTTLVLDMHAHMLDEGLDTAGASYTMFNGGPKGTFDLAKRMGVQGIGIMSWNGTVGAHADDGNRCVTDAINAYPDFYWGLGTFDVAHESADVMLQKMTALYADKRFLGLKPYPTYGVPYDDARYDCWWKFGNERKLYTGLHPLKWYKPDEFDSICSRFPDLTVVAYHVGCSYEVADTVIALAKKHKNFYGEITFTPVCGGIIDYLANGCGPDRILYGSDLPMRDPRQQFGWVVYSKLPVDQKKMILGENTKRIIDHVRAHQ